jgi:hypothetical protein
MVETVSSVRALARRLLFRYGDVPNCMDPPAALVE